MLSAIFRRIRDLIRNITKFRSVAIHPCTQFIGNGKFDYGKNCAIAKNVVFVIHGSMKIGSNVVILQGSEFNADIIQIGNDTSLQRYSKIFGTVKIGSYNILGPNLFISSTTHQFALSPILNLRDQDEMQIRDKIEGKKVVIGEDCWLGINVVVMPGITIGKGCVVGANSVVTKDVAPYNVVAGIPAKVISKRLNFTPPKEIKPCDEHVPYFYEGFKTRVFERNEEFIHLSAPDFSICLNTHDSAELILQIDGISQIRSGNEIFDAINGMVKIPIGSLLMDGPGILLSCANRDWENAKFKRIWTE